MPYYNAHYSKFYAAVHCLAGRSFGLLSVTLAGTANRTQNFTAVTSVIITNNICACVKTLRKVCSSALFSLSTDSLLLNNAISMKRMYRAIQIRINHAEDQQIQDGD